jgi:hypothetical protein
LIARRETRPDRFSCAVSHFNSEEEEAQWWYDNRDAVGEKVAQAMSEGKTSKAKGLSVRQRIEAIKSKEVNIRLPEG